MALSRREFLKHSSTLLGAFAFVLAPVGLFASPTTHAYYKLNATLPSEAKCSACRNHATYKLFASAAAADAARAHPYCQCEVVAAGDLPLATWTSLFGDLAAPASPSVDLRWANVRAVFSA